MENRGKTGEETKRDSMNGGGILNNCHVYILYLLYISVFIAQVVPFYRMIPFKEIK